MTHAPTQTPSAIPDRVARAAHEARLGPLVRVLERARMWMLFGSVWLMFLVIACFGGVSLSDGHKTTVQVVVGALLIGLPALAVLWVSVESPILNPAVRRRRVYVFADGFVRLSRRGVPTARRWDEVAGIYQNVIDETVYGVRTGSRNQNYRLHFTDGTTAKLLGFTADMTVLGPIVMDGVTEAQLPGAVRAVEAGRTIAFGPLTVNAQGVSTDAKTLPWAEVATFDWDEAGRLKIHRRGPGKPTVWMSVACRRISNLHTFIRLAERLVG
jgi:hypothetical protein